MATTSLGQLYDIDLQPARRRAQIREDDRGTFPAIAAISAPCIQG